MLTWKTVTRQFIDRSEAKVSKIGLCVNSMVCAHYVPTIMLVISKPLFAQPEDWVSTKPLCRCVFDKWRTRNTEDFANADHKNEAINPCENIHHVKIQDWIIFH